MDWRWLRWWYCACSAIALVNSIPACWLLSPRLLACSQSLLFHIFLVFHPLPLCSFLTRTWLGCRSLAIIHLYFVFTQTPARIFLPPNTQNALPGWKPEVCSNFFLSCVSKTPRFLPYPGWKRELCPNFSWLAKKVWSPKNVKSFHPPPMWGPARIPASLRSAREGGAPFGGGWKDFTFFGLYIFCPAS